MSKEYELIDCYESAKLPIYIPKRKVEAQPLFRSLRLASPGSEHGAESEIQGRIGNAVVNAGA
jgi:hypothetical protein